MTFTPYLLLRLVCAWLLLSTIVVAWDAGFVLLRPRSLPGGDLHYLWKPCKGTHSPTPLPIYFTWCGSFTVDTLYIEVDTRYGDMEDAFCIAQSL